MKCCQCGKIENKNKKVCSNCGSMLVTEAKYSGKKDNKIMIRVLLVFLFVQILLVGALVWLLATKPSQNFGDGQKTKLHGMPGESAYEETVVESDKKDTDKTDDEVTQATEQDDEKDSEKNKNNSDSTQKDPDVTGDGTGTQKKGPDKKPPTPGDEAKPSIEIYRVITPDGGQFGEFNNFDQAKNCADNCAKEECVICYVYDSAMNIIYTADGVPKEEPSDYYRVVDSEGYEQLFTETFESAKEMADSNSDFAVYDAYGNVVYVPHGNSNNPTDVLYRVISNDGTQIAAFNDLDQAKLFADKILMEEYYTVGVYSKSMETLYVPSMSELLPEDIY